MSESGELELDEASSSAGRYIGMVRTAEVIVVSGYRWCTVVIETENLERSRSRRTRQTADVLQSNSTR